MQLFTFINILHTLECIPLGNIVHFKVLKVHIISLLFSIVYKMYFIIKSLFKIYYIQNSRKNHYNCNPRLLVCSFQSILRWSGRLVLWMVKLYFSVFFNFMMPQIDFNNCHNNPPVDSWYFIWVSSQDSFPKAFQFADKHDIIVFCLGQIYVYIYIWGEGHFVHIYINIWYTLWAMLPEYFFMLLSCIHWADDWNRDIERC